MDPENSISAKKFNFIINPEYVDTNIHIDEIKETNKPKENSYKNNETRCNHPECNKKLKLTDIKCRCGLKFCPIHRYSDKHNCTFDYKNMGKNQLIKENPIVNFAKIEKL